MSVESIIKELTTLTTTELQSVKAHIDFLTKNKKSSSTITKTYSIARTSNLKGYLHICMKRYVPAIDISIIEYNDPKDYDSKLEAIAQAIEKLGKDLSLDRRQVLKLCQVVVEAAYEKIKAINYNLSFPTLLAFMKDPKDLLDYSYPGYVKLPLFKSMVLK